MKENMQISKNGSSVINRAEVKRRILRYAKDKRYHPFTRVSRDTLDRIAASVQVAIVHLVESAPSKGKTL
jgi:histone H3/H4